MKVSLNWLKRYLPELEGLKLSVDAIAERLSLLGLEVDAVQTRQLKPSEHLQVGKILESAQHPNADRLSICKVSTGTDAPHTIVCGAKNFKAGDFVAVALPGCLLPQGLKIKKSKLRGISSEGMLCSASELELGEESKGILILEGAPELGKPLHELFADADSIFELELTANRGDCLGHIGVARELAAYYGLSLVLPKPTLNSPEGKPLLEELQLEPSACPLYRADGLGGLRVCESPAWLQQALEAVGVQSVNNMVDSANYVMFETGQPLHVFDADKIDGGLQVRFAKDGELFMALNGKDYKLSSDMVVVSDAKKVLALAGIMGSRVAEVSSATQNAILECAWFYPAQIRRSSRSLQLMSPSAYRFARSTDPQGLDFAAERALELMLELSGGVRIGPPLIQGQAPYGALDLDFDAEALRKLWGLGAQDIQDADILKLYPPLGFQVDATSSPWKVRVPSFRAHDVQRPVDLIEEFTRLWGTEKIIPATSAPAASFTLGEAMPQAPEPEASSRPESQTPRPACHAKPQPRSSQPPELRCLSQAEHHQCCERATEQLVAQGFFECKTLSLQSAEDLNAALARVPATALENPISPDMGYLRASLMPALVQVALDNQNYGNKSRGFFELGHVFDAQLGTIQESVMLAFLEPVQGTHQLWRKEAPKDFYSARVRSERLAACFGLNPRHWKALEATGWQTGHAASTEASALELNAGLLNLEWLRKLGLEGLWLGGTLRWNWDWSPPCCKSTFTPYSQQPFVAKDIAFVVPEARPASLVQEDLSKALAAAGAAVPVVCDAVGAASKAAKANDASPAALFNCESIELFDIYRGEGVPAGQKNLAFALRMRPLRSASKALRDAEVNRVLNQALVQMREQGYELRA